MWITWRLGTFVCRCAGGLDSSNRRIHADGEDGAKRYIYGFPIVDMYRIMFGYNIDTTSPAYTAPFNVLHNTANVYTPADTTVQTPNSDTPYSTVSIDLHRTLSPNAARYRERSILFR